MAASPSPVARAAASSATPTSSVRRASNISARVKPCRVASRLSGSLSSIGGPAATKVPAPWRVTSSPLAASERSAARTLGRLTPMRRASSRSGGSC